MSTGFEPHYSERPPTAPWRPSAPLPPARCIRYAFYLLDQYAGRVARLERDNPDLRSELSRDFGFGEVFDAIIAALDVDGGLYFSHETYRRVFAEDNDGVYGLEGFEHGGPVFVGDDWPRWSFEPPDRGVGVEAHD